MGSISLLLEDLVSVREQDDPQPQQVDGDEQPPHISARRPTNIRARVFRSPFPLGVCRSSFSLAVYAIYRR
jgi:hypothetical protein